MLQEHKKNGYLHKGKRIIPLIVFDEVQELPNNSQMKETKDFFLSWCVHLTEQRYANVVLVKRLGDFYFISDPWALGLATPLAWWPPSGALAGTQP